MILATFSLNGKKIHSQTGSDFSEFPKKLSTLTINNQNYKIKNFYLIGDKIFYVLEFIDS